MSITNTSENDGPYYQTLIDIMSNDEDDNNKSTSLPDIISRANDQFNKSTDTSGDTSAITFQPQRFSDVLVHNVVFGTDCDVNGSDENGSESNDKNSGDNCSSNASSSSTVAMTVIHKIVAVDQETYLPAIAHSLLREVQQQQQQLQQDQNTIESTVNGKRFHVSTKLLEIWIYQMVHSDIGKARRYFTDALMLLLNLQQQQRQQTMMQIEESEHNDDTDLLETTCGLLCQIWKQSMTSDDTRKGSIVAVRCVSIFVQMLMATDDQGSDNRLLSTSSHAVDLSSFLSSMISDFNDPLQQMAVMDEIVQQDTKMFVDSTGGNESMMEYQPREALSPQLQKFWSSPDLMGPILQMLHDPILSSTALHYVTTLAVLDGSHLSTVLDYIRSVGTPPPTAEKDRLALIHAISNLFVMHHATATSAAASQPTTLGQIILNDQAIRCAWWGEVTQISNSKLQAAILMSIRSVLVDLNGQSEREGNDGGGLTPAASLAVNLYSKVGPDNDPGSTTTQWLLQGRFVANTIAPEIRIASYSLLASMLQIPVPGNMTTNPVLGRDIVGRTGLLDILVAETRETSSDARKAYFELLEAFVSNASLMDQIDSEPIKKKLKDKYAMGPHGRQPQRWDVATE